MELRRSVARLMKITVDISDEDLRDVLKMTGERKKGPAITKLVVECVRMERRRLMAAEVMSPAWRCELPDWREGRARERKGPAWGT